MKLHKYQERIVDFCDKHPSCILSVGMGLGKTAAVLHYIDRVKPTSVLIVAPKRVAETVWKQEAAKWGLSTIADKMAIVTGTKAKRMEIIRSNSYIIIGRDNLDDVRDRMFQLVILDELTSFKNTESKRADAICSINSKKIIGLTGTFLTNGAIDCFGQFMAVGFGGRMTKKQRIQSFYRWRATHFKDALAGSGLQFQKWQLTTPLPQLIAKVKDKIFTLDSKDWLEIPKVQHFEHEIELTEPEINEYLSMNTMLNAELDGEIVSFNENQKFAKLQTLCNGFVYIDDTVVRSQYSTKIDAVVEFVDRAVAEDEQVFLIYAFKEEKAWIEEKLKKLHIKFCDVKDRNFIQKWESGEIEVLLGHPASAGHGLNLQNGGRICVWSSLTYDFELWAQANARLARQGQTQGVQIHSFIAKNTVEVGKIKALNKKEKILEEFVDITK